MSVQQVVVIGLGQFGLSVAKALARAGVEVVAVDDDEDRVQRVAPFVLEALTMDAMDEERLAALRPARRDLVVVAMGDDSREASIVITALLKQMGAPRVVSRATDEVHERILRLVGAEEVFNPERSYGERLALRWSNQRILDEVPLGDDLVITELTAPVAFHGRRLSDLGLSHAHELTVMGIRRRDDGRSKVVVPRGEEILHPGDVLVLVGPPGAGERLAREVG